MKIFMLIIDGISDDKMDVLGSRTPFEVAVTPYMEYLAKTSRIGTINTVFDGYPIESLVCIMGLLGYDPRKYYPFGRASFEALARGISLGEDDLAFRCNIVQIAPKGDSIMDFTSGMILDTYAKKILAKIRLPFATWELYPGQSYRNLLIIRNSGIRADSVKLFEPHMHQKESLLSVFPQAKTPEAQHLVSELTTFMKDSYNQIGAMNMESDCKGNMLWFWSPSSKPKLPAFESLYGFKGAIVAGLDFMHGLAMATDMYFDIIPGATGYIDTNYEAKSAAAIALFNKYDFVLTHVNATDEAAHMHDPWQKIDAIEKIDQQILEPVFCYLRKRHMKDFLIVICGDHKTRCSDGKHIGDPVPFLYYQSARNETTPKLFDDGARAPKIESLDFIRKVVLDGANDIHAI